MPDRFMKLGTLYVNYKDRNKKKNTIEKKKPPVKVKNQLDDKKKYL